MLCRDRSPIVPYYSPMAHRGLCMARRQWVPSCSYNTDSTRDVSLLDTRGLRTGTVALSTGRVTLAQRFDSGTDDAYNTQRCTLTPQDS